jgi:ADP-ribosyl-[dinitrogen reductase] hydrolase
MKIVGFGVGLVMQEHSTAPGSLFAAFAGSLVADAVAMPVHWYYDTAALDRDYGKLEGYRAPRHPHPDSILWRSHYQPLNERGDILREQAAYWGQRGVHYHQFLAAGENTLNFKLARELFRWVLEHGAYDAQAWLERYVSCMLTPGWHRDTYVEEYHRAFFTAYAQGKKPEQCGVADIHIGGLATVPSLCAALAATGITREEEVIRTIVTHVSLTHRHPRVIDAAKTLTRLLLSLSQGVTLNDALGEVATGWISLSDFEKLRGHPDRAVVGKVWSPACYIDEAFPAALYLAWRTQDDFATAIKANALVGGDNCHRGAVVGALAGMMHGVGDIWMEGLVPAIAGDPSTVCGGT